MLLTAPLYDSAHRARLRAPLNDVSEPNNTALAAEPCQCAASGSPMQPVAVGASAY
jgi:hypothetical protein